MPEKIRTGEYEGWSDGIATRPAEPSFYLVCDRVNLATDDNDVDINRTVLEDLSSNDIDDLKASGKIVIDMATGSEL